MSRFPVQVFSLVLGCVYLIIGLAGFAVTGFDGFAVTGFDDFAAPPVDGPLIIFGVNPAQHRSCGHWGGGLDCGRPQHQLAKPVSLAIGTTYGLVTVLGVWGC